MWIESMNSFEIQCITEGLQIDKAGLSTKIQSQLDTGGCKKTKGKNTKNVEIRKCLCRISTTFPV